MKRTGLAALAVAVVALACGDVPTLPDGIAYISRIALPSPAVAAGDTLRDSTGRAARLAVPAFDAKGQLVAGVAPTYTVITPGPGVRVSADGLVTAADTVRATAIVARIGDRLQTVPETLYVVPQPDSIVPVVSSTAPATDTVTGQSPALQAIVSGPRGAGRVPVRGIVVRYAVSRVYRSAGTIDSTATDSTNFFLLDDVLKPRRSNQLTLADTTNESGTAGRVLLAVVRTGIDSVEVRARATNLRGVPLKGSPVRFIVKVKR